MGPDEAAKVIAAISYPALRDLVALLAETGARPGELVTATATGLSADGRTLRVVGKSGPRDLTLNAAAAELVGRLAKKRPTGPLLLNSRGKPWDRHSIKCAFQRLRKRTGVAGATAYAFRHLYASLGIERGIDPLTLSELMGHKDLSMLKAHYVRFRTEALRRAAEAATRPASSGADSAPESPSASDPPSGTPPDTPPRRQGRGRSAGP
jgi:integrase